MTKPAHEYGNPSERRVAAFDFHGRDLSDSHGWMHRTGIIKFDTPSPQSLDTPENMHDRPRFAGALEQHASPSHPDICRDNGFYSPRGTLGVFYGVGELSGSRQAAGIASRLLSYHLEHMNHTTSPIDAEKYIADGIRTTHNVLVAENARKPEDEYGATTGVVAGITRFDHKNYLVYGSVGDSRLMVFRPRNTTLRDVTLDETALSADKPFSRRVADQEMLSSVRTMEEYDALPPHQKTIFRERNTIAYALGTRTKTDLQTGYREVEPGDFVIAVTDAYTDNFTHDELAALITEAIDANPGEQITEVAAYLNTKLQAFMSAPMSENIRQHKDDATVAMIKVLEEE